MPNENQNDILKQAIDDAIQHLTSLEDKIDKVNSTIGDTKGKFTDAANGVKSLAKEVKNIDEQKAKNLVDFSVNIKNALEALSNIKGIKNVGDKLDAIITSVNGLKKIEVDTTSLDTLTTSLGNVNNELRTFLKLGKGLNAVDIQKLASLEIEIKDPKNKSAEAINSKYLKQLKNKYDKNPEILKFNIDKLMSEFKLNPRKDLIRPIAERKLVHGDFFTEGVTLDNLGGEDLTKLSLEYGKFLQEMYDIVEENKPKKSTEIKVNKTDNKEKKQEKLDELKNKRRLQQDLTKTERLNYVLLATELEDIAELGDVFSGSIDEIEEAQSKLLKTLEKEIKDREELVKSNNELERTNKKNAEARAKASKEIADLGDIAVSQGYLNDKQVRKLISSREILGQYKTEEEKDADYDKVLETNREAKRKLDEEKEKQVKEERARLRKENKEARDKERIDERTKKNNNEYKLYKGYIDSNKYEQWQAKKYGDLKLKTGGYSGGKLIDELTDTELEAAIKAKNEEVDKLILAIVKDTKKDYDKEIERLDKERKDKARKRELKRDIVNDRTAFNAKQKRLEAEAKREFDSKDPRMKAFERLVTNLFGADSPILTDIIEMSGILGDEFESIQVIKDKRKEIDAKYNEELRGINNYEMSQKQKIEGQALTKEQLALLNSGNLTEEQAERIRNSADSAEVTEKKLKELQEELNEKREKASEKKNDAILKNEEELKAATLKAAGSVTKLIIAIKMAKIAIENIYKVTKKAAQSNTNMAASLKSMGADASEINSLSISVFTNELKNSEQRLKSIGRNLGDMLAPIGVGWANIIDEALKGIEWITDKLAKIPGFFGLGTQADDKQSINYSTSVLTNIADRLDKGITVDGVEIKLDKETVYQALNQSFGKSKTQGFSNRSSTNMASKISDMAAKVQANYGVDYNTASQQISDAIFNGSNAASAYGIAIDDQILTGWVAMTKQLDMANVQYTDAQKSAWRFEMAQQMIAEGNSEKMREQIKQWKQLGDVIQTASGQLFDFQEVQSIEAKDFTIPEVGPGGTGADAGTLKDLNEEAAKYGDLWVQTGEGMMLFQDALAHVNGDINQFKLYWDEANKELVLATSDYLPSLTAEEQKLHHELDSGISAIATYARHVGLTDLQMINLARDAGMSEEQVGGLKKALDLLTEHGYTAKFNYSDITEAKEEAIRLNQALANAGYLNDGSVDPGAPDNSYAKKLNKYSKNIQEYVNNGYSFSDGTTVDDISGWEFLNGFANPFSKEDKKKVATWADFSAESGSGLGKFANAYMDFGSVAVPVLETAAAGIIGGKVIGKVAPGLTSKVGDILGSDSLSDALFKSSVYMGHADGGLSFKDHVARVSEGNMREVILPLTSQDTITALAGALTLAGAGHSGSGVTVENININNDGINISDNPQAWRKVGIRIADEISAISRERGDLNYGIK